MNRASYIYCEPFCGMAAVFYHLLGCKPPISYMGSKAGYTSVIADILGLSRHHRPAAVVLGDVGPTVAVHAGLFGASGVTARDVAGCLVASAWTTLSKGDVYLGPDRISKGHDAGSTRAITLSGVGRAVQHLPDIRAAQIAAIIRSWKDEEPRALWTRLKAEGWPSLMPPKGARWGQPILGRWLGPQPVEEVAGWFASSELAARGDPAAGYAGEQERYDAGKCWTKPNIRGVADALDTLPSRWPRVACYQGTASRLVEQLPGRLDSWICYLDPPYFGTTGYPFGGCGREEVLRIALDLHRRGATVAISEAVRLDRELGGGWYAVQIDHARRGQKRTFSVQQSEWVTVNRAPVNVPGKQVMLFGGK